MVKERIFLDKYKVVLAQQEDGFRIWEIRNDPVARKNSRNSKKIELKDHLKWFGDKYFNSRDNFCFVVRDKKNKTIGYCRFDFQKETDSFLVAIAVDCKDQKKGLGNYLLSNAIAKFRNKKKNSILAEIKKNNIPSIKLFEKNGFKKHKILKNIIYYKK